MYGNIFREALYAQDIRGLKQYELTDHLGNVLATVSDKRSAGETTGLLTGADSILTFRPVLASAYDYYPFGSFMPGRYVEDTNSYCFTTTETKYVVVPYLEIATPSSGSGALISPGAGTPPTVTDVPGGGIDIDFDPVDAGTMASVSFTSGIEAPANTQVETNIEVSVLDAVFNISVIDDSTGSVLASRQVASMQGNTNLLKIIIPNPASRTRIRVTLDQPGQNINRIRINVVRSTRYITTTVNVISTVCNKAQYPFGFNGQMKVDEVAGKGNHVNFGDRALNTRIGRWQTPDKLKAMYPGISSYVFAMNTPIWAKDPDGKVVVFVNGNHYGDGGKADYWHVMKTDKVGLRSEKDVTGWHTSTLSMQREYRFDDAIMNSVGDHKAIYRDGALGGWALPGKKNMSSQQRTQEGYKQGVADAQSIIANLQKDDDGNITETIKIVTHSMGGAYGKGYANGLLDYAMHNKISRVNIEYELDFAPFQPDSKANNAVKRNGMGPTYQFSHKEDAVAGNKPERCASQVSTSDDPSGGGLQQHSIGSFENSAKKAGDFAKPKI